MKLNSTFLGTGVTKGRLATNCLIIVAFLFAEPVSGFAQSADEIEALKNEIRTLKEGQAAIQRDLAEIKQLLLQRPQVQARSQTPPFNPLDLSIEGSPYLGEANASVTLVEFTDYQCPYCRRHSLQTKPRLIKEFVETGKLKYVLREFPIESLHPQAVKAAEAALCAGDQGKYWEMGARFFENQSQLRPEDLVRHAEALGLDVASFKECLDGGTYSQRVRNDLRDGAAAGLRGTPSFLLGRTDPDNPNKIRATKYLRGAQSYATFRQIITQLSEKGS